MRTCVSGVDVNSRGQAATLSNGHSNVRRAQASPLSICRDAQGCQRDIDCQPVSAAMALTACPVHSPFSESNRPACRGLDMRKVWKSATCQMDATLGASKSMSAASAHLANGRGWPADSSTKGFHRLPSLNTGPVMTVVFSRWLSQMDL